MLLIRDEQRLRKYFLKPAGDEGTVCLVPEPVFGVSRFIDSGINMVFNEGCQIGKEHVQVKFLDHRDGSGTIEGFDIEPFLELIVFAFGRPAHKIQFLEHVRPYGRIIQVRSKVFLQSVIEGDFNDTNLDVICPVRGIALKGETGIAAAFFRLHRKSWIN